MKKTCILFVLLVVSLLAAVAADGYAEATFATRVHDFGVIREQGGPVSYTFELTNTGNKSLLILDVTASCGCTRPEYPTKPIKPGKKAAIKVTYSPLGRPGAFRKTLNVKTNGREHRQVLLIEGTAVPGKAKNK